MLSLLSFHQDVHKVHMAYILQYSNALQAHDHHIRASRQQFARALSLDQSEQPAVGQKHTGSAHAAAAEIAAVARTCWPPQLSTLHRQQLAAEQKDTAAMMCTGTEAAASSKKKEKQHGCLQQSAFEEIAAAEANSRTSWRNSSSSSSSQKTYNKRAAAVLLALG